MCKIITSAYDGADGTTEDYGIMIYDGPIAGGGKMTHIGFGHTVQECLNDLREVG